MPPGVGRPAGTRRALQPGYGRGRSARRARHRSPVFDATWGERRSIPPGRIPQRASGSSLVGLPSGKQCSILLAVPGQGTDPQRFSGANAGKPNNRLSLPRLVGRWQGFRPAPLRSLAKMRQTWASTPTPTRTRGEQAAQPPLTRSPSPAACSSSSLASASSSSRSAPPRGINVVRPPVADEDRLGPGVSKRKPAHVSIVVPNYRCAGVAVAIGLPGCRPRSHPVRRWRPTASFAPPSPLSPCSPPAPRSSPPLVHPATARFPPTRGPARRSRLRPTERAGRRRSLSLKALPSASPTSAAVTRRRPHHPRAQVRPHPPSTDCKLVIATRSACLYPGRRRLQNCNRQACPLQSSSPPAVNANCLLRRSRARAEPHSGLPTTSLSRSHHSSFSVSPPHVAHPVRRAGFTRGSRTPSLSGHVGGIGKRTC